MRRLLLLPYLVFLCAVLIPVGAVAYALSSIARAAWEQLKAGWKDHS